MQFHHTILAALAIASIGACSTEEPPVYETSPDRLYKGSLYYATSEHNCKNCHGVGWDGNGPEAAGLSEEGITVSSFIDATPAEVTPVDYFKAITVGTENTRNLPGGHAYQSHTDRARWAMAHYLYSLAPPVAAKDKLKREEAIHNAMLEAKAAYKESRRWHMGYTLIPERPQAPELENLSGYDSLPENGDQE
jgi:hypothetical protein